MRFLVLLLLLFSASAFPGDAGVERRAVNNGQLIMESVPDIPDALARMLARYQNERSSSFVDWAPDGDGIYIKTRHNGVDQIQWLKNPGGEPKPVTSSSEPVGEASRQPGGEKTVFTMDSGGSGFDQIFLLDPEQNEPVLLTDGTSLNNRMVWDSTGRRLAYRSTRRNGRNNDIWVMDVDHPDSARPVLEVDDGALWKPIAFDRGGRSLLIQYYASIEDSRIYLLDLETGNLRLLAGDPEMPTGNVVTAFDHAGEGIHFMTNRRNRAVEIAWMSLAQDQPVRFMPSNIPWDVTGFHLSEDGRRGAFVVNEEGISRLYLLDPLRQRYRKVSKVPTGVIGDLKFSPDGRYLGLTLSTPNMPGNVFVLELGKRPLSHKKLLRWTGGKQERGRKRRPLEPELIHFPSPMQADGQALSLPAFVYRPRSRGPVPVIIYIHGGPESQFRPGYNPLVRQWVEALGVAVIAPNVRGSLGYGLSYLAMDDGHHRENAIQDIGALLDWIGSQSRFDASRVVVYGASYGGYMALASAVHYSDRLSGAIDRAGISRFVTFLENTQDYRRDLRRAEYGDERIPETREFLERISPLHNVGHIDIPLLIAQGENDPVVPASESAQMVNALRARGQTVWYLNALNEGHNYARKENRDVFEQVAYLFLQKFLLNEAPQSP